MKKLTALGLAALFVIAASLTACSSADRNIASERRAQEYQKHNNDEWKSYFDEKYYRDSSTDQLK